MTDAASEKARGGQGDDPAQPARPGGQGRPRRRQWINPLPQVAGEDVIALGGSRYAHFRRDRRFAQVQVAFTAPAGVDPDPGRELTDQLKGLGWTWRPDQPGKPWIYQLEKSSDHDPTARGDSRDVLHEQFVDIVQEYREKHGMLPTSGWRNLLKNEPPPGDSGQEPATSDGIADASAVGEEPMPPSQKRETRAGGPGQAMLDLFASVGAERFDLTLTDAAGGKVGFRGNRSLAQLREIMPAILEDATARQHNVILRPRSSGPTLVQLDDLGESAAARMRPVSFLLLRTSPGSYQAWVAVADADDGFARRLRTGTGADLTASGATRVSGSINFKDRYAPAFPTVETVHASPGLVVTPAELEALGAVAPAQRAAHRPPRPRTDPRGWPDYQRCLDNAPPARGGGRPDISRADYTFCLLALDWGWSVEEVADRLMQESGKAQANGQAYALRTARNAAGAIEQRGARRR